MTLLIIIIAVVAVLAFIGVKNRETLKLWVKGSVDEFIDKSVDRIKVAKARISEYELLLIKLVDQAATFYAELEIQTLKLKKLTDKINDITKLALEAKNNGNKDEAIKLLRSISSYKNQQVSLSANVNALTKGKEVLETRIDKLKIKINESKLQIESLDIRSKTNKLISSVNVSKPGQENLNDTIDNLDDIITKDELKTSYLTSESIDDTDDLDLDSAYEELR